MTIINETLIELANDNSFFNRGNGLERDAQVATNSFRENFTDLEKRIGAFNERQREILDEREAGWRELVAEQYNDMANFEASNVPWHIAGPANYNFNRYNKRLDAAMNRFQEKDEKRERFIKNTCDMLMKAMTTEEQVSYWRNGKNGYGEVIATDDPLAVEKMEAHLEFLKGEHEKHVTWNKSIRRTGGAQFCEGMGDEQKKEVEDYIKQFPYKVNKFFFTDQEQANIRNKEARLEQLKKSRQLAAEQKENGNSPDLQKEGLRMQINYEAARVQLIFDGKPDEAIRAKLKANGFRWSPRFGAWQRQNTPNGIYIARKFFEEYVA
ncbi:hypothetical protein [Fibrobacter sp. UWH4]|uniref:hypothetical protein n=1 Tax=Fibrobacter sp. UWH4 TaxID=1896210 RepID=UPI000911E890|nr:hypothetical protein [Fibrobacter sp. UWH4]SHL03426.1 hypothetical protein SAMN05720762_10423 [Fibrobacter sp. UWH4]